MSTWLFCVVHFLKIYVPQLRINAYIFSLTKKICQDVFRGRPRSICAVVGRQDFREVLAQLMGPCSLDFLTNGKKA